MTHEELRKTLESEERQMVDTARSVHPLLQREPIITEQPWSVCREALLKSRYAVEIANALHVGFACKTANEEERFERITLYLQAAFGYQATCFFHRENEYANPYRVYQFLGKDYRGSEDIRRILARKACEVLCQHVFKNTEKEEPGCTPSWWPLFENNERNLLNVFLQFFAFPDNLPRSRYADADHNDQIAFIFLARLAKCGWQDIWGRNNYYHQPPAHFIARRPDLLKILWRLKALDFFEKRWTTLNPADWKNLKELATARFETYQEPYTSIEAAALDGHQAAKVYLHISILKKEKERQDQVAEEQRKIKEAERNLAKLATATLEK